MEVGRAPQDEAHHLRRKELGRSVERAAARFKPEIRVVEYDETRDEVLSVKVW